MRKSLKEKFSLFRKHVRVRLKLTNQIYSLRKYYHGRTVASNGVTIINDALRESPPFSRRSEFQEFRRQFVFYDIIPSLDYINSHRNPDLPEIYFDGVAELIYEQLNDS